MFGRVGVGGCGPQWLLELGAVPGHRAEVRAIDITALLTLDVSHACDPATSLQDCARRAAATALCRPGRAGPPRQAPLRLLARGAQALGGECGWRRGAGRLRRRNTRVHILALGTGRMRGAPALKQALFSLPLICSTVGRADQQALSTQRVCKPCSMYPPMQPPKSWLSIPLGLIHPRLGPVADLPPGWWRSFPQARRSSSRGGEGGDKED